jgi:hypothetical protein
MISILTFKEEVKGQKSHTIKLQRDALILLKAIVRPVEQGSTEYGIKLLNNSSLILNAPLSQRLPLTAINGIKVRKGELTVIVETKERKTVYTEIIVREK